MAQDNWHNLGSVEKLRERELSEVTIDQTPIAISYRDGKFGAISGICLHAAGPLGQGLLDGDYVVCPWHNWRFHRETGSVMPEYGEQWVSRYDLKIENGNLFINLEPARQSRMLPPKKHPLEREIPKRNPGDPIRVAGISTTIMDAQHPRYSTSDKLLEIALNHAKDELGAQTLMIKLNDLKFRSCEGYYSKSAHACTWPCSITQMDEADQLTNVYEALIFWADIILVSTPIRWGAASSLYYKMAERLNCVQNQITINDRVLIQDKVAGFIITGGQDNVQAVAGQMLGFFAELGFTFPPFPYIAHSRGWSAEDMERNIAYVENSSDLREGAKALVERCMDAANALHKTRHAAKHLEHGGRKAQPLSFESDV
ncbi:Rieske 2Fe-2S domain-containing protein [Candidatus Nitrosotenuis cloacae]|uniref:Rieske 2Fe-2S domain-containing protein n=1 Tax=Candidatus Nitrosotenuis cloacae TaxID=1603555 RepID=UPI002282484C|nr:Rieske 2Fe-2S domain-containing protein [Candidatus Nitrosotenuis cloacae]